MISPKKKKPLGQELNEIIRKLKGKKVDCSSWTYLARSLEKPVPFQKTDIFENSTCLLYY